MTKTACVHACDTRNLSNLQIFFWIFVDHEIGKNTGGGSLGLAGGPFEYFGALNLTSSRRVAPNVGASKVLDDLLCIFLLG